MNARRILILGLVIGLAACSHKLPAPTSTYDLTYEFSDPSYPAAAIPRVAEALRARFKADNLAVEQDGRKLVFKVPYPPALIKTYEELQAALSDFVAATPSEGELNAAMELPMEQRKTELARLAGKNADLLAGFTSL